MLPLNAKNIQIATDMAVCAYKIVLVGALIYQIIQTGVPVQQLNAKQLQQK